MIFNFGNCLKWLQEGYAEVKRFRNLSVKMRRKIGRTLKLKQALPACSDISDQWPDLTRPHLAEPLIVFCELLSWGCLCVPAAMSQKLRALFSLQQCEPTTTGSRRAVTSGRSQRPRSGRPPPRTVGELRGEAECELTHTEPPCLAETPIWLLTTPCIHWVISLGFLLACKQTRS